MELIVQDQKLNQFTLERTIILRIYLAPSTAHSSRSRSFIADVLRSRSATEYHRTHIIQL
jgi:hypothetical protein